ncbi:MAG: DHH family phosphoesterase [Nanoarchaeota archaeon]
MLTPEQISSIRERLLESQNPLFLFDNDTDGLVSFLLLRRFIDRGKGFPVKSFPELNTTYSRKLDEFNPDCLFILDKALVSPDFLDMARQKNIPVVWIDHHDVTPPSNLEGVEYYNPLQNSKNPSSEPTTYWCWLVTKRKEDMWLAMVGCLADAYLPDFSSDLHAQYPDYWREVSNASEGRYKTQIGKIGMIFSFGLKDKTTNVISSIKFLCAVKSPSDVFQESGANTVLDRYSFINGKYQQLISKAKSSVPEDGIVYFQYGGDMSMSADISDELFHHFPDKVILVCYIMGAKANISIRSKTAVLKAATDAIKEIDGATGGGHKNAVGSSMPAEDVLRFKKLFAENLKKK